jgi:hypothetical protein
LFFGVHDAKRPGSAQCAKNASFLTPVEVAIPFPNPPPGSTTHGYEEYFGQELVVEAKVTRYLRERIVTPDGQTLLAPLPAAVRPGSHCGPISIGCILYSVSPLHRHATAAARTAARVRHRQVRRRDRSHPDGQPRRFSAGEGRSPDAGACVVLDP